MSVYQEIPLNKLVPSPENVRKTGLGVGIDELAASIAAHGLLQNLPVKPVLDEAGAETGKFEVVAGGRRYAALKLLAKQKRIAKSAPVACNVLDAANAVEISLAENITQLPMHPADQYEAFEKLHREQGMSTDDIAARFGLSTVAVRQRMKLGAVSPKLMQIYRDGDMNLEQLMAFTITDDHARQERVWFDLSWNKSREIIRRALTEDQASATDRRAILIGVEAYEAAGGIIVRDLFDEGHAGFFADPALLDRLVKEKLEMAAQEVATEGWKWTEVAAEYNYSSASGMRRVYPEPIPLPDEEQTRLDALEAEYEALSVQHDGEAATPEIEAEFDRLDAEIESDPESSVEASNTDASYDVETGEVASNEEDEPDGLSPLSDKLVEDLTYHRTAALQDQLADQPGMAVSGITHALALREFYGAGFNPHTCLKIESSPVTFGNGVGDGKAARAVAERHEQWARRLPRDSDDLWGWITDQDGDTVLSLLAFCVARTVHAVKAPWSREPKRLAHADDLASRLALDMTSYWSLTVNSYLGRVTKARIIEAVREGVSEEAAERIADMKKQPMAEAAEQLLITTAWLPPILRTAEFASPVAEDKTAEAETAGVESYPHAAE